MDARPEGRRRLKSRATAAAAAAAMLALAAAGPAGATAFCTVRQTRDGFVALRDGPSPAARLVGRIRPRDEVMLGDEERGDWVTVTWWTGDTRLTRGFEARAGTGWVNRRLLGDCG